MLTLMDSWCLTGTILLAKIRETLFERGVCDGPKRNLVFLFCNISTSFDCLLWVIDPTDDDGGIHFSKKSTLWSV